MFPKGCLPKLFGAVFGVTLLVAGVVAGLGVIAGRTTANVVTLAGDMMMTPVESSDGRQRGEDWPSVSTTSVPTPPSTVISPPTTEPQATTTTVEATRQGPYTFMGLGPDGATPVRWEPCKPIHYVVNAAGAPPGTDGLIERGLERVAAATGFSFIYDGPTTEEWKDIYYDEGRPLYQKDRYGDRFAPVLFDWGTSEEYPKSLGPDAAAIGGYQAVSAPDGAHVAVSGNVLFDIEEMTKVLRSPGYTDARDWWPRATVMHEVGHVVGLGHVTDPTQIMHGEAGGTAKDWGTGDLAGLSLVSQGKCYPDGL